MVPGPASSQVAKPSAAQQVTAAGAARTGVAAVGAQHRKGKTAAFDGGPVCFRAGSRFSHTGLVHFTWPERGTRRLPMLGVVELRAEEMLAQADKIAYLA